MRKTALYTLIFIGIAVGGYWISPNISLYGLAKAIQNCDETGLEKYVDWARLRQHIKSKLQTAAAEDFLNNTEKGNDLGNVIAQTLAPTIINRIVDNFVTPEFFAHLLAKKTSSWTNFRLLALGLRM